MQLSSLLDRALARPTGPSEEGSGGKVLLISGVDITTRPLPQADQDPFPDYRILIDQWQPDIIDPSTVAGMRRLWDKPMERLLGISGPIALAAFLRRKRYRAIVAAGEDVGLPLALLLKQARSRTPLLVTCHNIATRRPSFYLRRLRAGSAVSVFQCLSQSQAELLQERTGTGCRTEMLYWHVDHEFFRPMPDAGVRHQICSAGMAARDYATLVEAAAGLDIDVKIAADSSWYQQTLNIDTSSLPARVEARSYGNYRALRQLYAESKIVVVPLLDVNFSAGYTVILEAMAMGKPVVVTQIRQQDDFIIDGHNGIYVPPGDTGALRNQLQYLLDNPEEAERLGANARRSVEERFKLSDYGRRMQSALDIALGTRQLTTAVS